MVISSQHLHAVESIADQILILKGGRPVFNDRVENLGRDRKENLFELSLGLSRLELERLLEELPELSVEEFGGIYHVRVARTVTSCDLLKALAAAKVEVKHFRDISTSIRRLFETEERTYES